MAAVGQNLLDLIAGRSRPVVKSAQMFPTVADRSKPGPAVVTATVEDNPYRDSVNEMQAEISRKAQEAAAAREPQKMTIPGEHSQVPTGDTEYDNLPDVKAQREAAEKQRLWDEYAKSQGVEDKKTFAQVRDEHKGFQSLGDRLIPEYGNREEGKTTGQIIRNGLRDFGEDWAHDTMNNYHALVNNIQRGAGDVSRFVAKWVDPRSWGSSTRAQLNRQAHDNSWDNARAASEEKNRRILESMNTGLGAKEIYGGKGVSTADKWLARLNYGTMAGTGQFAGGDAVTAGLGHVANLGSKAITAPTQALARGAGNLTSKAVTAVANTRPAQAISRASSAVANSRPVKAVGDFASPVTDKMRYWRSGFGQTAKNLEASRAQRLAELPRRGIDPSRFAELADPKAYRQWWAHGAGGRGAQPVEYFRRIAGQPAQRPFAWRAGQAVERGINEVGETLASPLTLAGKLRDPVGVTANTQTAKAVFQPVTSTLRFMGNPIANGRAVAGYAMQHPFRAAGRALSYPVRYPYNVGRATLADSWKAFWSMPSIRLQTMAGAGDQAYNGDYAGAAGTVASMAPFGALGWKYLPIQLGHLAYGATAGNGEEQEQQ